MAEYDSGLVDHGNILLALLGVAHYVGYAHDEGREQNRDDEGGHKE